MLNLYEFRCKVSSRGLDRLLGLQLFSRPPSYAAGCEAVALPAAATAGRRREQRAARAVPVAAAADARPDGAAVGRPRHRELVPLHRGLCLDYACKSNPNSYDSLTLFT